MVASCWNAFNGMWANGEAIMSIAYYVSPQTFSCSSQEHLDLLNIIFWAPLSMSSLRNLLGPMRSWEALQGFLASGFLCCSQSENWRDSQLDACQLCQIFLWGMFVLHCDIILVNAIQWDHWKEVTVFVPMMYEIINLKYTIALCLMNVHGGTSEDLRTIHIINNI